MVDGQPAGGVRPTSRLLQVMVAIELTSRFGHDVTTWAESGHGRTARSSGGQDSNPRRVVSISASVPPHPSESHDVPLSKAFVVPPSHLVPVRPGPVSRLV